MATAVAPLPTSTATRAVSAIRSALRDEFLTKKRDAAVPAVSRLRVHLDLIYEHRGR